MDMSLSTLGSVSEPITAALPIETIWQAVSDDPTKIRFDMVPVEIGGPLGNLRFATISQGSALLCVAQLSAAPFDIAPGRTLTIWPNRTNRVFTLG